MGIRRGAPYSLRGEGFCLRAAQDEVSTERPSIIRKQTYVQHNPSLLRFINSAIKTADPLLISDPFNKFEVDSSSPPSISIHHHETSPVSLSPSHCTCKESNADSEFSPCPESSVNRDTSSTNSCFSDSSIAEGDSSRWAALGDASLEQFEDGVEYIYLVEPSR